MAYWVRPMDQTRRPVNFMGLSRRGKAYYIFQIGCLFCKLVYNIVKVKGVMLLFEWLFQTIGRDGSALGFLFFFQAQFSILLTLLTNVLLDLPSIFFLCERSQTRKSPVRFTRAERQVCALRLTAAICQKVIYYIRGAPHLAGAGTGRLRNWALSR